MHHVNRHDVITSDDIQDVQYVHITEENGQKVAYIKAVLDPRKQYQASGEVYLHLTNGINHRTLGPFEHAKPVSPQSEEEASTEEEHLIEEQAENQTDTTLLVEDHVPEIQKVETPPTHKPGKKEHQA